MKNFYSNQNRWILVFLGIWLILSCVSCTVQNTPISFNATTATLSTQTTASPTISSEATFTTTPQPIDTPLVVATPTWTPVATLPAEQALEILLTLYADNGGCELPCWWGISPGKTSWAEARTLLGALGRTSGPWGQGDAMRYDFIIDVPGAIEALQYFEPHIGVKNNVVIGINVNSRRVSPNFDYTLAGILQKFGPPEEIWLEVITDTPYEPYYNLDLFYGHQGIIFSASGILQRRETRLLICPQEFKLDTSPPALMLWDPSLNLRYSYVLYSTMGWQTIDPPDFRLLEELSIDFNHHDFYETYLDPQASFCFPLQVPDLPQ